MEASDGILEKGLTPSLFYILTNIQSEILSIIENKNNKEWLNTSPSHDFELYDLFFYF